MSCASLWGSEGHNRMRAIWSIFLWISLAQTTQEIKALPLWPTLHHNAEHNINKRPLWKPTPSFNLHTLVVTHYHFCSKRRSLWCKRNKTRWNLAGETEFQCCSCCYVTVQDQKRDNNRWMTTHRTSWEWVTLPVQNSLDTNKVLTGSWERLHHQLRLCRGHRESRSPDSVTLL